MKKNIVMSQQNSFSSSGICVIKSPYIIVYSIGEGDRGRCEVLHTGHAEISLGREKRQIYLLALNSRKQY